MANEETHNLISSDKVEDTKVYDLKGNDIGNVEKLMLEKKKWPRCLCRYPLW